MRDHQVTIVATRRDGKWTGVIVSTTHDIEPLPSGKDAFVTQLRALADAMESQVAGE